MYLFSEKSLSNDYSVWWCGALTYLRTSDIFNQNDKYTASDMICIKKVGALAPLEVETLSDALLAHLS